MREYSPSGDPLLDEVDEMRLRLLAEHGGDYRKVWESYLEGQKQFADRLVNYSKEGRTSESAA